MRPVARHLLTSSGLVVTAPAPPIETVATSWIYVTPTGGNNANGRQSTLAAAMAAPMATPQNAADKAIAGTAVVFANGTWNAASSTTRVLSLTSAHAGTQALPIFFIAEDRRQAIFNGPTNESCVRLLDSQWIEIHGLRLVGNHTAGNDLNCVKVEAVSDEPTPINLVVADCSFEGNGQHSMKGGTVSNIKMLGCVATGNWSESGAIFTTNDDVEIAYSVINGRVTVKGGTTGVHVHHNTITSDREAMLDGELGESRSNRLAPVNPPFPWAEAYQSEWHHNALISTDASREPGWTRGAKECYYHHNFFSNANAARPARLLQANVAYYQDKSYADVPVPDRPYIQDYVDATFDYHCACRDLIYEDNAYLTGMTSGVFIESGQNNNISQSNWFAAASFAAAFPGIVIGNAGWDTTAAYLRAGLL